jgi:hypothetical protein
MEKLEWVKADAATIKAFEASQKTEIDEAREAAEAEANYRMNLELAEAALRFERLTAEDREDIEIAVTRLKIGWALHKQSSDPIQLRRAANHLLFAAHVIGSRCTVCDSEKKYWNLKSHGPAGEASGRSRNNDADVWRVWVRQEITRLIETNPAAPDDFAEKMRANKTAPGNLPCHDRLVRFIREELKSRKGGLGKRTRTTSCTYMK